jgi:serralysin
MRDLAITVTNVNDNAPSITSGLLSTSVLEGADAAASTATQYALSDGQTAQGSISVAGDHDYYKVYLTAGVQYSFAMTGVGTTDLTDTYLSLLTSNGSIVNSNDNSLPSNNSVFTYTPDATGYYYLDASAKTSTATGAYSVAFTQGSKPSFSANMGAGVMDYDISWSTRGSAATITYGFRESQSSASVYGVTVGTVDCKLSTAQMNSVLTNLQFWADVCGLNFLEVNPGGYTNSASILFGNYSDATIPAGGFADASGLDLSTGFIPDNFSIGIWLNLLEVSKKSKEFWVINLSIRISNISQPIPINNTIKNILKIDLKEKSLKENR